MTKEELIKKAHENHQRRLELKISEVQSLQSLKIELEHIENPELSEGRKSK